jgi:hypothetical protein
MLSLPLPHFLCNWRGGNVTITTHLQSIWKTFEWSGSRFVLISSCNQWLYLLIVVDKQMEYPFAVHFCYVHISMNSASTKQCCLLLQHPFWPRLDHASIVITCCCSNTYKLGSSWIQSSSRQPWKLSVELSFHFQMCPIVKQKTRQ